MVQENGAKWSLHGKTALVTGGTKGIGCAVVEELASLGAVVYTCSRSSEQIETCLREWKEKGFQVFGSVCDVSSRAEREKLIKEASTVFGHKFDILINLVGKTIGKPTLEYTEEDFSLLTRTNLESAYHMCQLAHPFLKASGAGTIVFMSSASGVVSINFGSIYAATKGAINQLTKNLACEWASDNIRTNAVAPWFIRTPLGEDVIP